MKDITNKEANWLEERLDRLTKQLEDAIKSQDLDSMKSIMAQLNQISNDYEVE